VTFLVEIFFKKKEEQKEGKNLGKNSGFEPTL